MDSCFLPAHEPEISLRHIRSRRASNDYCSSDSSCTPIRRDLLNLIYRYRSVLRECFRADDCNGGSAWSAHHRVVSQVFLSCHMMCSPIALGVAERYVAEASTITFSYFPLHLVLLGSSDAAYTNFDRLGAYFSRGGLAKRLCSERLSIPNAFAVLLTLPPQSSKTR